MLLAKSCAEASAVVLRYDSRRQGDREMLSGDGKPVPVLRARDGSPKGGARRQPRDRERDGAPARDGEACDRRLARTRVQEPGAPQGGEQARGQGDRQGEEQGVVHAVFSPMNGCGEVPAMRAIGKCSSFPRYHSMDEDAVGGLWAP